MSDQKFDLSTKEGYLAYHKAVCDKMHAITRAKNADYTGGSSDPFANFQVVSSLGICNVETGFLVRMSDKMMRIISLADGSREAQVKDESIEDTLLDLANYSILLAGYLRKKREDNRNAKAPEIKSPLPITTSQVKYQWHYTGSSEIVAPCKATERGPVYDTQELADEYISGSYLVACKRTGAYKLFEVQA